MGINKNVERMLIAMDAVAHNLLFHKRKLENRTVLLVFHQVFGDAVIISRALDGYSKLFPKSQGYRLILLARPSVIAFMHEVLPVPEDLEIRAVDFKRFLEDYSYYKQVMREYRNLADVVIVPGTSLSGEIFAASSMAARRVGLEKCLPIKWPPAMVIFRKLAYTETVKPEQGQMMLQHHRMLLHYLGLKEYQAELPTLLPKSKIIAEERYCVLCPGASSGEKCWPTERYAEVMDDIIKKYHMRVHLCGGKEEEKFGEQLKSLTRYPEKVVSHIGKTGFSDWSAIVQHAELVIGNDSATLHLAVAGRRKAVCITGVYDGKQFFPYQTDILETEERMPIVLFQDMPCQLCRTKGYYSGYKNHACKKAIHSGKCTLCIEAVSVKQVKKAIDSLMLDG